MLGEKLFTWDPHQIAVDEVKYLQSDEYEDADERSEEELFQDVCEDSELFEEEWESLLDHLSEEIEKRNPLGEWEATVDGFGWRGLSGIAAFYAGDGKTLLQKVLPKTDCTFTIYAYGEHGLAINNFHHDAPTGKEWYHLLPGIGESRLSDAYDQATVAALALRPELSYGEMEEAWDWDPPKLRFLQEEDYPRAAILAGGAAFRSLMRSQGIEDPIDLSELYAGEAERCKALSELLEAWKGGTWEDDQREEVLALILEILNRTAAEQAEYFTAMRITRADVAHAAGLSPERLSQLPSSTMQMVAAKVEEGLAEFLGDVLTAVLEELPVFTECLHCKGEGYVSTPGGGWASDEREGEMRCPTCGGRGEIPLDKLKEE